MRYYEQISGVYILAIGIGVGNTEITETKYNEIMFIIQNRPNAIGKGYHLKTDLMWEEYDLPYDSEPSDEDELSADEVLAILLGGAT